MMGGIIIYFFVFSVAEQLCSNSVSAVWGTRKWAGFVCGDGGGKAGDWWAVGVSHKAFPKQVDGKPTGSGILGDCVCIYSNMEWGSNDGWVSDCEFCGDVVGYISGQVGIDIGRWSFSFANWLPFWVGGWFRKWETWVECFRGWLGGVAHQKANQPDETRFTRSASVWIGEVQAR